MNATSVPSRVPSLESRQMSLLRTILTVMALTVTALAAIGLADETPLAPPTFCSDSAGGTVCKGPAQDLKQARRAFQRGLVEQYDHHLEEAYAEFDEASRLVPNNGDYLTAREILRQAVVSQHLDHGNQNLQRDRPVEAMAEFRSALHLDPTNQTAQQQVQQMAGVSNAGIPERVQVVEAEDSIDLTPETGVRDFHYRGDSHGLIEQVAAAYGLTAVLDPSVPNQHVRFDLTEVDFFTAMRQVSAVTKTFWTPLEARQIYLASDTVDFRHQFERMGLRTFFFSDVTTPSELTDYVNIFRGLFEIKFVTVQAQKNLITVRAPLDYLNAASRLFDNFDTSHPEVLLEVNAYQVSHSFMHDIGGHIPNQFKVFNIPAGALAALGGQSIGSLINQLISSGGINQAGSTGIAALLAQLQGQQDSIFSQPIATFGGGKTLSGISFDRLSLTLSLNENALRNLEHATLRSTQGKEATLHLGTRYPILNSSFAPASNSPAIARVLGNNTFIPPFPSFSYEDLGLSVKAKPSIHGTSTVSLDLDLQLRTLGGSSANGIPVIANREYKGSMVLADGEPAVIAGSVSRQDQKSLNGIPALAGIPSVRSAATETNKQQNDDELLIVITPHIIRSAQQASTPEIWLGR